MSRRSILIVDDEKNIRLTVSTALESMEYEIASAVNGEEALAMLQERDFSLILLDLKLPGMDGVEVLKKVRESRPETRVIILTAHGTVQSAVETLKLGAADFMQKPFTSSELRDIVSRVLNENAPPVIVNQQDDPGTRFVQIKKQIDEGRLEQAEQYIKTTLSDFPERPEPYNLLGAVMELKNRWLEALKFYRAALDIDPTYKPAMTNLDRAASFTRTGRIALEEPFSQPDSLSGDRRQTI